MQKDNKKKFIFFTKLSMNLMVIPNSENNEKEHRKHIGIVPNARSGSGYGSKWKGELTIRKTGTHLRVPVTDNLAYFDYFCTGLIR